MNSRGQVMVEAVVALSLLLIVLLGIAELAPIANQQHQSLVLERDKIWSRNLENSSLHVSSDYPAANASGRVLSSLSELISLDFDYNNFWQSAQQQKAYPMARISNSWSAASEQQLSGRPAKLVVNSLLSGEVTQLVQNVVSKTPITEELRPDSLIFGHIDSDVVPEEALQEH